MIYKEIPSENIQFREYSVNKEWVFTEIDTNIKVLDAIEVTESYFYSGTEPTNSNGISKRTLYDSIKHLYYKQIYAFEPTGSLYYPAFENFGKTNTEKINKNLDNKCKVISIPQRYSGNGIKEKSVHLEDITIGFTILDDGLGNLYDTRNSSSFSASSSLYTIGNVFYEHANIVITNTGSFYTGSFDSGSYMNFGSGSNNYIVKFESKHQIYEHEITCTVKASEFNYTLNNSILTGSVANGQYMDFVTGSNFAPYITTIGLYNEMGELLIVGKLNQSIKNDPDLDLTFVVRLDT